MYTKLHPNNIKLLSSVQNGLVRISEDIPVIRNISEKLDPLERTPNLIRVTGPGVITPVVYSFSVYNSGTVDGAILGEVIKPKEALNFSAGAMNNYYTAGSIAYDGTGTELVIIFNS
jgi:hypothetical protein